MGSGVKILEKIGNVVCALVLRKSFPLECYVFLFIFRVEEFNVEYYSRMWVDKHYFTDAMIRLKSPDQLLSDDIDDEDDDDDDNDNPIYGNIYLEYMEDEVMDL